MQTTRFYDVSTAFFFKKIIKSNTFIYIESSRMCTAGVWAQLHLAVCDRWHSSLLSSEKHVSSFIIQRNWTRVRVYRYLVQQQKQQAKIAVNTAQAATPALVFLVRENSSDKGKERKHAKKKSQIYVCTQLITNKKQSVLPVKLHCKGIQIARKT